METATVGMRDPINPATGESSGTHGWRETTGQREGARPYPETFFVDSKKEFETIKERGLYRGPGTETPEETEVDRPVHIIKENAPVVEELFISKQVHEIVPKVYREHEMSEIRHAVLPIRERVSEATTHSETRLEEIRSTDYLSEMSPEEVEKHHRINEEFSRVRSEEMPTEHVYRYHTPIVHKVVKPRIIHEVHPVITREIEREHVRREILPVYERIVDGARISNEIDMLKSMSKEEWEREKRPEERYSGYLYRTPPRSPARERTKLYTSPERVQGAEALPTARFSENERAYYGAKYKVLEPGYTTSLHPGETTSAGTRHDGFPQRASHLVHPVGHEADRLHRMSPIGGYATKESGSTSYLQTPTASPR